MHTLLKHTLFLAGSAVLALSAITDTAQAAGKSHRAGGGSQGARMNKGAPQAHSYNAGPKASHASAGMNSSNRHANHFEGERRHRGHIGVYLFPGDAGGCGYEYRKRQQTGSRYWRSRYQECNAG